MKQYDESQEKGAKDLHLFQALWLEDLKENQTVTESKDYTLSIIEKKKSPSILAFSSLSEP